MIQFLTLALTLFTASPVAGSPLDAAGPSSSYTRTADVSYGTSVRQKPDVYVPNAGGNPPARAVIIFLYGGGWEIGRRERYRFVGKALTGDGFVAVVPDYRVYPDALFPDFIFDAANAVRWTKDNIARFGGDAERIFLMGHSLSTKNGSSASAARNWPPPVTGKFCPVLPCAITVTPARSVTDCTPLAIAGPNVASKTRSVVPSKFISTLMWTAWPGENVVG